MYKMHIEYGYISLLKNTTKCFSFICLYVLSDSYGSWYYRTPRGKIKHTFKVSYQSVIQFLNTILVFKALFLCHIHIRLLLLSKGLTILRI